MVPKSGSADGFDDEDGREAKGTAFELKAKTALSSYARTLLPAASGTRVEVDFLEVLEGGTYRFSYRIFFSDTSGSLFTERGKIRVDPSWKVGDREDVEIVASAVYFDDIRSAIGDIVPINRAPRPIDDGKYFTLGAPRDGAEIARIKNGVVERIRGFVLGPKENSPYFTIREAVPESESA